MTAICVKITYYIIEKVVIILRWLPKMTDYDTHITPKCLKLHPFVVNQVSWFYFTYLMVPWTSKGGKKSPKISKIIKDYQCVTSLLFRHLKSLSCLQWYFFYSSSASKISSRPPFETREHDIVEMLNKWWHYARALCGGSCQMLMESLAFDH